MPTRRGPRVILDDGSELPAVVPIGQDGGAAGADGAGVSTAQTYVPVAAYNAADTSGPSGSNATIVQVLAANTSRKFLKIINRGTVDAELWIFVGAKPQTITVGRGDLMAANGGGALYDARVPTNAIFATAASATGLMVLEG